jgi:lysine N6-hydroxylase
MIQISVQKDVVGVGAGPANLSLAALLASARERGLTCLTSIFLEKNQRVFWHSGQMFAGTLMQTEFYRDLVTPVDPTSRFSFLNYLKLNGRLDQFLCSEYICPTRREFEDYFNWVAAQLPDVVFGTNVFSVDYDPTVNLFCNCGGGQGRATPLPVKTPRFRLRSNARADDRKRRLLSRDSCL